MSVLKYDFPQYRHVGYEARQHDTNPLYGGRQLKRDGNNAGGVNK